MGRYKQLYIVFQFIFYFSNNWFFIIAYTYRSWEITIKDQDDIDDETATMFIESQMKDPDTLKLMEAAVAEDVAMKLAAEEAAGDAAMKFAEEVI